MIKYKLLRNLYPFRKGDVFYKLNDTEYVLDKGSFKLKLDAEFVEKDKYMFSKL
jgi:hypothetical protein